MPFIPSPPPPPPLPPPSNSPPPQFRLKEVEELNTETAYTQRQTIQEWLLASIPGDRSLHTIPHLHRTTLIHGLSTLRHRIADLVNLDLKLYHKHASLLSDSECAEKAFAYTGWCWVPPPDSTLELLNREELEQLLWQDVRIYDEVARSVRLWKREIDARIGQQ